MDETGRELVSISEFMMTRILDKEQLTSENARRTPGARRTTVWLDDPRVVAEEPVVDILKDAIRPAEGLEVLDRVLSASGSSQFIVAPQDLTVLLNRLRAPATIEKRASVASAPTVATAEIEAVLSLHPAVRSAVVLQRRDRPGNIRLVAYVVQDPDAHVTVSELRRYLRGKLPQHMVPSSYVPLDSFPMAADGSVDRGALPDPFGAEDDYVAPRTETETLVAEIWRDVLGVERVSVYDNFFDIGGHSLLAVRVVTKLDKKIGVRLNQAIMVLQTLEQISAECDKRRAAGADSGANATDEASGMGRKLFNALKQKVVAS
jgi:acyl carrier protein